MRPIRQEQRPSPMLGIGINLVLFLAYLVLLITIIRKEQTWQADFSAFYTGWSIVLNGEGEQLYSVETQMRYQHSILGEGRRFKGDLAPYLNPPHMTLPFVPLALLSRPAAYIVWAVAQLGMLVWLSSIIGRMVSPMSSRERWLITSSVLALWPLFLNFALGAFSLLMLICLLEIYLALKRNYEVKAGWWLAIGLLKPQAMLAIGIMLLAGRRWKALGATALWLILFTAVTLPVLGAGVWLDYLDLLRIQGTTSPYSLYPASMYNLRGALSLLLGEAYAAPISLASQLVFLAVAGLIGWLWRGPWAPSDPRFELRLAFTMLAGLLFTPYANPQDGLLAVAPALLGYLYLRRQGLGARSYAIFIVASLPAIFFIEFLLNGALGIRAPVVVLAVLLIWLGRLLLQRGAEAAP